MEANREQQLRNYAAGKVTWHSLHQSFDNYVDVLAGLGELGLSPPVAPMEGPNVKAREKGRALIRRLLQERLSQPPQP